MKSSYFLIFALGLTAASAAIAAPHAKTTLTPSEEFLAPPLIGNSAKEKVMNQNLAIERANQFFANAAKKAKLAEKKKAKASKPNTTAYTSVDQRPGFDLPVTYNSKVRRWIRFFQTTGQRDFKIWLERSARYEPKILPLLQQRGLPQDLFFLAMIESGFSARAVSTASAVGYWQFMAPTAKRYGLETSWWLDERRDIIKSTVAAASYLNDLYRMFDSWYLAAAAYNMGEGRTQRLIKKYNTRNYWELSKKPDFPKETESYVPKIIAAMLIAKAPHMYGFQNIKPQKPYEYEVFEVPGGTDLENLAYYAGIDKNDLRQMNPELVKGFVPQFVDRHTIRLPRGAMDKASEFVRASL